MSNFEEKIEHLPKHIEVLNRNILNQNINKEILNKLQVNLDNLDQDINDSNRELSIYEYSNMLELQGMIHYAKGSIEKATVFINDAQSVIGDGEMLISSVANELIESEQLKHETNKNYNEFSIPEYFTISTIRLISLSIITFSTYLIYWSYRNWKAVQIYKESTGIKMRVWPVLTSFFFPLTSYELFLNVRESYKSLSLYDKEVSAGAHGWGVFLLNQVFLAFIPVVSFQKFMNFAKLNAYGEENINPKSSGWEIAVTVVTILYGLFLWVALITATWAFVTSSVRTDDYNTNVNSKEQQINQSVNELKNKLILPEKVDENTQLVDIKGSVDAVQYYYQITGVSYDDIDRDNVKQSLVNNICGDSDAKKSLNEGLNYEYYYNFADGRQSSERVTLSDC